MFCGTLASDLLQAIKCCIFWGSCISIPSIEKIPFLGVSKPIYNNILPTLSILNEEKKEKLILELNSLDFKL